MKTIKCSQVGGGSCPFEVTTDTKEGARAKFSEHAKAAHTEMVKKATPESMKKWHSDFNKIWADTPEN